MNLLINQPSYIIDIFIAVLFFVTGQILLKKSFTQNNDYRSVAITFGLAFGISALAFLFLSNPNKYTFFNKNINYNLFNAFIAGLIFFFGNLFWIKSISSNKPLGNIRVIMAGMETFTLFIVGILLFKEIISIKQILGTLLILSGIYIFGSN